MTVSMAQIAEPAARLLDAVTLPTPLFRLLGSRQDIVDTFP